MPVYGLKVYLRHLRLTDAQECYENLKDKIYYRMAGLPYPYSLGIAQKFIKLSHQRRRKGTDQIFAIVERDSKRFVGALGLHDTNSSHFRIEIGYWLAQDSWGKGYVSESVSLALNFAFRKLKMQKIYAHVFENNIGSQKVLLKNRFKLDGILRKHYKISGKYIDGHVYSILKSDYYHKNNDLEL